ncbi:MAG: hypothetical protein AAGI49_00605 [Bacteroidota bacterium]
METYDESVLKAKFKHLSVDKAYLYNAILRSMRDYHSKKSRAAQIKEHLMDAKYLYERELYDLCEAALQEAKQLAEELGDHLSLLVINKEERKLVRATKQKGYPEKLEQLLEEKNENLEAAQEEYQYLDLYDRIWKDSVQNIQIKDGEKEKFRNKAGLILNRKQDDFKSIIAEHRYYQSSSFFYQNIGEYDKVFDYRYKAMNWWDKNPKYKEEAFYNYIIDLSNFLAACFKRERFDLFNEILEKLEKEEPANTHHQKVLFQKYYQFKLVYNINYGITSEAKKISELVEDGLKRFTFPESTKKVFVMNTSLLLFVGDLFSDCIYWTNGLLASSNKNSTRMETNRGMYFVKLISSYEIDDFELFDNTIRSTNRFLIKDNNQYLEYYLKFLDKIKKLPSVPIDEVKYLLQDLKNYINQMRQEIKGRVPLGGIDEMTIWWIDSKLQKKSIAEIVRAGRKTSQKS